MTSVQIDGMLNVMVKGVFYAVKHRSRAMMVTSPDKPSSSGAIVVTASVGGMNGKYADMPYCKLSTFLACADRIGLLNLNRHCKSRCDWYGPICMHSAVQEQYQNQRYRAWLCGHKPSFEFGICPERGEG